ncbi:dephospho-CoA kinase [Luteibacter sp. PvP120]
MDPLRPDTTRMMTEALSALRKPEARGQAFSTASAQAAQPLSLRQRLRAIVGDAPHTERDMDALRLPLLRCILAEQWGDRATDDPLFHEILAAVDHDMQGRPELRHVLHEAVLALLKT